MTHTRKTAGIGWIRALPALLLVVSSPLAAEKVRPAEWAVPVTVEGVPNLYRLTRNLYRSAQPTLQGFNHLRQMGIRIVINLRGGEDDARAAPEMGFRLESVPLSAARIRHDSNVQILRVLGRAEEGPILVHCQHGSDRTGMICALYRMVYQGWDRGKAIEEMRKGGYGFHAIWGGLVDYLERVDVEALRKEVVVPPRGGDQLASPISALQRGRAKRPRGAPLSTSPAPSRSSRTTRACWPASDRSRRPRATLRSGTRRSRSNSQNGPYAPPRDRTHACSTNSPPRSPTWAVGKTRSQQRPRR
jgi:protein tyrosine phosphatase (PTP) superfamily phosphohydrolase (DUF442 family)